MMVIIELHRLLERLFCIGGICVQSNAANQNDHRTLQEVTVYSYAQVFETNAFKGAETINGHKDM